MQNNLPLLDDISTVVASANVAHKIHEHITYSDTTQNTIYGRKLIIIPDDKFGKDAFFVVRNLDLDKVLKSTG